MIVSWLDPSIPIAMKAAWSLLTKSPDLNEYARLRGRGKGHPAPDPFVYELVTSSRTWPQAFNMPSYDDFLDDESDSGFRCRPIFQIYHSCKPDEAFFNIR